MTGDRWPFAFADGLTGAVQAKESELPPTIQFGDDAPIALPAHGLYPIGAITPHGHQVLVQTVDDAVVLVTHHTGMSERDGRCYGTDAVWLTPAGVAVIVRDAYIYTVGFRQAISDHPGGQGFAQVSDDGVPIWMDSRLVGTVHGRRVCRWSTSGQWTVAQDAASGKGVVHDGARWLLAIDAALAVAPRIVEQHDGSAIVTCFPGWLVHSRDFTTLVEDVDVLPSLDLVPMLNRPMTFAAFSFNDAAANGLGNVFIPVRPSVPWVNRQVIVSPGEFTRYRREDVFAVWAAEGGPDRLTLEQALLEARPVAHFQRLGLIAYADTFGRLFVPALRDGEVYSEPFYREVSESTEAYKSRCQNRYAAVVESRRFWPTIGIFSRGWTLTDLQVVESFHAVADLALRQGWSGALAFAVGRQDEAGRLDMPPALVPHVQRFVAGLRGTVPLVVTITTPPIDPEDPPEDPPADDPIIDPDEGDEMPKELLQGDALEQRIVRAGKATALLFKLSDVEGIQGCRQASDAFRLAGRDATAVELIEASRWRAFGVTPAEVEALALDCLR